jgi:hypothetical protein
VATPRKPRKKSTKANTGKTPPPPPTDAAGLADQPPPRITLTEFTRRLLAMPNATESEKADFARYVRIVRQPNKTPSLLIEYNSDYVIVETRDDAALAARGEIGLGFLNDLEAGGKRSIIESRLASGDKRAVLLMQGDSWFEYPVFIKDISDQLIDKYNAYSFSAAGDLLERMVSRKQYLEAYTRLAHIGRRPKAILLSGGGNDLVGDNFKALLKKPTGTAKKPLDFVNSAQVDKVMKTLSSHYQTIIEDLQAAAQRIKAKNNAFDQRLDILVHTYDYALPIAQDVGFDVPPVDGWTGKPMRDIGLTAPADQMVVIKHLIDRFHATLTALAASINGSASPTKIWVVDNRGAVKGVSARQTGFFTWSSPSKAGWNDELHPNDLGFKEVVARFETVLKGIV